MSTETSSEVRRWKMLALLVAAAGLGFSAAKPANAQANCFTADSARDTVMQVRRSVEDAIKPLPGVPPEEGKYIESERDAIESVRKQRGLIWHDEQLLARSNRQKH